MTSPTRSGFIRNELAVVLAERAGHSLVSRVACVRAGCPLSNASEVDVRFLGTSSAESLWIHLKRKSLNKRESLSDVLDTRLSARRVEGKKHGKNGADVTFPLTAPEA